MKGFLNIGIVQFFKRVLSRRLRNVKILYLLLAILVIASMVGWSFIEAVVHSDKGYVALVGKNTITTSEFSFEIEKLKQNFGRIVENPTLNEKIENFVFRSMAFDSMIDQEMKQVGFLVSDKSVIELLRSEVDRGVAEITKKQFEDVISMGGSILNSFIEAKKRRIFLASISPVLSSWSYGSIYWVENTIRSRYEKRVYDLISVNYNSSMSLVESSRNDLISIYEQQSEIFQMPMQYEIVSIASEDIKIDLEVTDDEIEKKYNETFGSNVARTRRDIDFLVFKSKEDAEKAIFLFKSYENSIKKVVSTMGKKVEVKSLRGVTRLDIDQSIADQVFIVPVKKPSAVLSTKDGFAIAFTNKVFVETMESFGSEVKEKIKNAIIEKRRCDIVRSTIDRIRESASVRNFKGFEVLGEELNIKVNKNTIYNAKEISKDLILESDILQSMKIGDVEISEKPENCSFKAFQLLDIIPSKKKTIAQAMPELKKIALEKSKDKATYEKARYIVDRISSSKVNGNKKLFENIIIASNLSKKSNLTISRIDSEKGNDILPIDLAKQLFMTKVGSVIGPYKNADGSYYILILRDIVPVSDSELNSAMASFISDLMVQKRYDYLDSYENYLRGKYPVKLGESYKHLNKIKSIVRG